MSQGISRHSIDIVILEYSCFINRLINNKYMSKIQDCTHLKSEKENWFICVCADIYILKNFYVCLNTKTDKQISIST